MTLEDQSFAKFKEEWLEAAKKYLGNEFTNNKELLVELAGYMWNQVNKFTESSVLNYNQYGELLSKARQGAFLICYINHYTTELIQKEPILICVQNFLSLQYGKVLNGNERVLLLEEIRAKQQVVVNRG